MSIAEDATLALPPWVRLRFDAVRGRWVLLAPERVLFPCETSVAIIQALGERPRFADVVDRLAAEYEAPRDLVAADTAAMLADLAQQNFLEIEDERDG